MKVPRKIAARQHEITRDFLQEIDKHLDDILAGRCTDMYEIRDIAAILHIDPRHLSNTIKLSTGQAPCFFFEEKIMHISRELLRENKMSISEIAIRLTYDPSNFTKFFKRFSGQTPKQFREAWLEEQRLQKTETVTI